LQKEGTQALCYDIMAYIEEKQEKLKKENTEEESENSSASDLEE